MRKEWDVADIDYLKEYIGSQKITMIAESMGRSYESVRVKMNRLGMSNTKAQTGLLTIGELAKLLKVERNTVKGWVERHGLSCVKKITRRSKAFYLINPKDFWKWAEKHKDKVQFSNIEPRVIIPEPAWVEDERQKDQFVCKKRVYKYWTTMEDRLLLELRNNKNLSFAEIGQKMNRSSVSVARRYSRIQLNSILQ
ncbi:helix-turn-helix domain-containing protein [Calidifontibacillus oryziterrae]|uniref:helix-turn-helix domain-containing protein n=1 Tax=Calidifontibacillus oryziterrae TaxID=1191699 RepID=UPI0002E05B93|nr:helix-turn-helix domain-containing protein [Calidifontibacillus oryziterrae]